MTAVVSTPTQSMSAPSSEMLDVIQVGEWFKCSSRHVYRMSDAGLMPRPVKLGNLVRWNRSVIEKWIAEGCPVVRHVSAKGDRS